MKLTILGGGGFRVPLVYAALLSDTAPGRVTEVRLYDTSRIRLDAIRRVLRDQAVGVADAPTVLTFDSLEEALADTDFVFSAIRVGGVEGRALDEETCRAHGVLGQETVGAGGISYALRSIPTAVVLASTIKTCAPQAWTINFTNPAGVVTEVMAQQLGGRVIGICDSPVGLAKRVMGALGVDPRRTAIDYVGLNHLGWLRSLRVDGVDVLPRLFESTALLESFEEGRLFGERWLRALQVVPNEYLHYYYFARETRTTDERASVTRGRYLARQQAAFYREVTESRGSAFALWERTRLDRETTYGETSRAASGTGERDSADLESGGYEHVALALMRAIAHDEPTTLILNVKNGGTLSDLDDDAVVEVPCRVDAAGATPLPAAPLPDFARGLVVNAKYVERCTIEAALTGSRTAALKALAHHPLVDSVTVAALLLDADIADFTELAYLRG